MFEVIRSKDQSEFSAQQARGRMSFERVMVGLSSAGVMSAICALCLHDWLIAGAIIAATLLSLKLLLNCAVSATMTALRRRRLPHAGDQQRQLARLRGMIWVGALVSVSKRSYHGSDKRDGCSSPTIGLMAPHTSRDIKRRHRANRKPSDTEPAECPSHITFL